MKEIVKITISLTGVCIAAALILGFVFTQTEHARKEIEEKKNLEDIEGVLGFGGGKKAPAGFAIHPIHRYVVSDPDKGTLLAYIVPVKGDKFMLVEIDLGGKPVKALPMEAKSEELAVAGTRDAAVKSALPQGSKAAYAETFYVADQGAERYGYVLPGITQGFKTFIKLLVALDPKYTVTGIAIQKSEEDPGLGDKIKQEFFRNQFVGKTLELLGKLEVTKDPLPQEYSTVLDPLKFKAAGITAEKAAEVKQKHLKDNIYALTGATISSRAVTRGVRETVKKFTYRFDILNKAAKEQNIQVAF